MTYARVPLEQAFDTLTAELDDLIGRVLRQEPHLYLEHAAGNWQVVDIANQNVVMIHSPDIMVCVRFMEAFATRHPEATVERWSIAEAVRLANIAARKVAGEPMQESTPQADVDAAHDPSVTQAERPLESASPAQHSVKVPALRLVEAVE